jgi:outer membrane protein OmpA-like peptidoglycan-associated protein
MFGGVRVTQRLVRVGGNFRPVGADAPAQYYRIEYEIENADDSLHAVGLLLLIDTMIDDNDACQMDADGTRVRREQMMAGKEVPSQILIYRTAGSKKDMTGVLVTDAGEAPRPDALYIGRWPELHSVVWEVSMADRTYDDSAILQKWSPTVLAPGKTRRIATHYGLPQPGDLNILNNEKLEQLTYTIYFGPGQSAVNGKARREIAAMLRGKQVEGVVVSAHADASGDDRTNMAMSKRRLASLRSYLRGHRVPASAIVPKAFGESNADQSALARRRGKAEDRKVDLTVYVKDTGDAR